MDNDAMFNLPIGMSNRLAHSLLLVTIEHAGGERVQLRGQDARFQLTEEHPPVERMADDWGAICEVFKQNVYYYVTVGGVRLLAGDQIILEYGDGREPVTLRVIELENGRARVQDPGR